MTSKWVIAWVTVVGVACHHDQRYPGTYQGVIEFDERDLAFEVGGRLVALAARRGDDVAVGQLVATLDDTLPHTAEAGRAAEVEVARAREALVRAGSRAEDVRAIEAQIRAAEASEALAAKNLARDRQLVDQGALARAALDDSETRYRRASADLAALREQHRELRSGARREEVTGAAAQATAADAALRLERARTSKYQLYAVAPATVLDVHAEPGEVVAAGTPVVTVADVTHPYADVFVPQDEVGGLAIGTRAAVFVDSLAAPIGGAIEDIARRTAFTPRFVFSERERATLVIRVRVRIDDRARVLHAGVPAFVAFDREASR